MQFQTPILPRITKLELIGFRPIFQRDISISITNNKLLILGGNGLGKTTALQSVVYCVAGEADLYIELEKSRRWGRKYFIERLDDPGNAQIKVDLFLGDEHITLVRGFRHKNLIEFRLNDDLVSDKNATAEFDNFLVENIGYRKADDFRFIVHRLCYLAENRDNVIWDSESQIRLLMLLFNDIVDESEYREKRKNLKELDSRRRHANVYINKAQKELQALYGYQENNNSLESEHDELEMAITPSSTLTQADQILHLRQINSLAAERLPIQTSIKELKRAISLLAQDLEDLQEQLGQEQEAFILFQLEEFESDEVKLAIHKLIHRQMCPACGTSATDLSRQARDYMQQKKCPLCGTDKNIPSGNLLPLLDAQISEKIRAKVDKEVELLELESQLEAITNKEQSLQFSYDEFRLGQPIMSQDYQIDTRERGDLRAELTRVELDYQETSKRFEELRNELQQEYERFSSVTSERVTLLGNLYKQYATDFLGIPCELIKEPAGVKFLNLELFVPQFNGRVRTVPETCSEAQRFFLDIAFRMALIDLASQLSSTWGTFICETPENALDITYVDNVASMFHRFSNQRHTVLATGNLQPGALAKPILKDLPTNTRRQSILNLLEFGNLSQVQREHIGQLESELQDIVEAR